MSDRAFRCKECGESSVSVAKPCPKCGGSWELVPEEPKPLDVQINARERTVTFTVHRQQDLAPVSFSIPFTNVKAIAAQVLLCEVNAEGLLTT